MYSLELMKSPRNEHESLEKLGETLEILALSVDCTKFTVNGQAYRISRTALIRHSGFFENLLRHYKEDESEREPFELTLPEQTQTCFENILQFLGTGALDVRLVTEENFVQMLTLAEFFQAPQLLSHLQHVFCFHWHKLCRLEDFLSEHIMPLTMAALVKDFNGTAEDKLLVIAHWARDWMPQPHNAGCAIIKTVDVTEVSTEALTWAKEVMSPSAFSELDFSGLFHRMSGLEAANDALRSELSKAQAELQSSQARCERQAVVATPILFTHPRPRSTGNHRGGTHTVGHTHRSARQSPHKRLARNETALETSYGRKAHQDTPRGTPQFAAQEERVHRYQAQAHGQYAGHRHVRRAHSPAPL